MQTEFFISLTCLLSGNGLMWPSFVSLWDILDSTKNDSFEYITDESRDFLIFNTNDFHADTKALHKIKRITGMRLVQMSTHS